MNLLKDNFISTTEGKISLRTLLTSSKDYQLQYYFDEIQLAMLQLLSSLTTALLSPSLAELKDYLTHGVTEEQYDQALIDCNSEWFDESCFMQSRPSGKAKWPEAPVTKLLSGVECGSSANANGLFSDIRKANVVCSDCTHVLNYNLHMNIKGECFSSTGATGIRGGGSLSTLIAGSELKQTVLNNTLAYDYFADHAQLAGDSTQEPMWVIPITGKVYQAQQIGLIRGLFALAYHIRFQVEEAACICDVCGCQSDQSVRQFSREKYTGHYGSTKTGRESGAGWWPHPYTPITIRQEGTYPVCPRDQHWQSWEELTGCVVGREVNKATIAPAYIVKQFQHMKNPRQTSFIVGGNIANQGTVTGRVYDLYAMPSSLNKHLIKVTQVIDIGLELKERLSSSLNKLFGAGYDKNFITGIKQDAINSYTSNAQRIIQQTLLDVDWKEAAQLRKEAASALKKMARAIYSAIQQKYQCDLPLFKALVKGEIMLNKK